MQFDLIIVRERSEQIELWMDNHRWVNPHHVSTDHDWSSRVKRFRTFDEAYSQLRGLRRRDPDWDYVVTEYTNR